MISREPSDFVSGGCSGPVGLSIVCVRFAAVAVGRVIQRVDGFRPEAVSRNDEVGSRPRCETFPFRSVVNDRSGSMVAAQTRAVTARTQSQPTFGCPRNRANPSTFPLDTRTICAHYENVRGPRVIHDHFKAAPTEAATVSLWA